MAELIHQETLLGRRKFQRYALDRDCAIIYRDLSLTARLTDISLGGAGLHLPMHVNAYRGLEKLVRFRLPEICSFRADVRWKADHDIGLQFEPAAQKSASFQAFIAELAAAQADSRDTTTVTSGFLPISD